MPIGLTPPVTVAKSVIAVPTGPPSASDGVVLICGAAGLIVTCSSVQAVGPFSTLPSLLTMTSAVHS